MQNKSSNIINQTLNLFFRTPNFLLNRLRKRIDEKLAYQYFIKNDLFRPIKQGKTNEIPPNISDLTFLHKQIRIRRPKCILEFGVGYSTIVMAHALSENDKDFETKNKLGNNEQSLKLFCVDTNKKWLENTEAKMDAKLRNYVEFLVSKAEISVWEGEICHFFDRLPDVVPKFCYLDGPDPAEVTGSIRGIKFPKALGPNRSVIAADILLYESTLKPSFFMVVDGRYQNVQFLRRHLKRRYKFKRDKLHNRYIFELLE